DGVWLVTFKKAVPEKYVSREAVLDELLCFGWIDGRRKAVDEARTSQLITPRRHDRWTASYRDRFGKLEAEGRVTAPGRAAAERAQAAGTWVADTDIDALVVPDDVAEALRSLPPAETNFAASAASYRRNVLRWIASAKRDATRRKRIETLTAAAAAGERLRHM
ncbi:MAG: YdeI/OmpD-associated family protein, partial [Planctomycetota bacterium]